MANNYIYDLRIYNNNGSTLIWENKTIVNINYAISANGISGTNGNYTAVWRYTGDRTFAGFAASANQSAAASAYEIGRSFACGSGNASVTLNLYIVETGASSGGSGGGEPETVPAHLTIEYNGNQIYDADVSAQTAKTLSCAGKLMSGNVAVTVTPGTGTGGGGGSAVLSHSGSITGRGTAVCGFRPDIVMITSSVAPMDCYIEGGVEYPTTWLFDFREHDYAMPVAYYGNADASSYSTAWFGARVTSNGFQIDSGYYSEGESYAYAAYKF